MPDYNVLESFELYHGDSSREHSPYGPKARLPPVGHAISGAVGAGISTIALYPLDVVVTRLQTQQMLAKERGSKEKYLSLLDAFEQIYQEEGLAAFFAGATQDTINCMASTFLYHLAYNFIRMRRLTSYAKESGKSPSTLGITTELAIGAVAGLFSRFLTTPLNNIVVRKQTASMYPEERSNGRGGSTMDIANDIYEEKGITGFWSGYRASAILTVNPSITYYLFELLQSALIPKSRRDHPSGKETFLIAAISKAIASAITYPVTLTKARMQVKSSRKGRESPLTVLHQISQQEGWPALYEGILGQVIKGFFSQGILMLFKEKAGDSSKIKTNLKIGALMVSMYLLFRRTKGQDTSATVQNVINETGLNGALHSTTEAAQQTYQKIIETAQQISGDINSTQNVQQGQAKAKELYENAQKASSNIGKANGLQQAQTKVKELYENASDKAQGVFKAASNGINKDNKK